MEEGNTKRARIPTNFFVQQNSKERELETLKKSADRPKKKHASASTENGTGIPRASSKSQPRQLVVPDVTLPDSDASLESLEDSGDESGESPRKIASRKLNAKRVGKGGAKGTKKDSGVKHKNVDDLGREITARDRGKGRMGPAAGRGSSRAGRKGVTKGKRTSKSCANDSEGSGWATGDDEGVDSDIDTAICHKCKGGEKPEKMLLCDTCDRGWHIYCLDPPLKAIPKGDWNCPKCVAKNNKKLQEFDPKGWLNEHTAESQHQDDGYESNECSDVDAETGSDPLVAHLGEHSKLGDLSGSWELASVVHFLGVFGVQLSLCDAAQPVGLSELASALRAEDGASNRLLAHLHIGLLGGTNQTRSVPLDEQWWPTWLAKWAKRRNTAAAEREGKPLSFFQGSNLREDDKLLAPPGANYNELSAVERLQLLHQLCCDRLESKRPLVETHVDTMVEDLANNSTGVTDIGDAQTEKAGALVDAGADVQGGSSIHSSRGENAVPASWRPKPKVVDSKGRRYWYFSEAPALRTSLFRSTRHCTPAGTLLPPLQETPLSSQEEKELWACCTGGEIVQGSSDEEEQEAEDKCEVCESAENPEQLMLCDMCDETYHTYCLRPVLKRVPTGEWVCPRCDTTGQSESGEKAKPPIALGLKKIETIVHIHWETSKKEIDGLTLERVLTRRPKKAIGSDGRTFDVHYTYNRIGKQGGRKAASSGIFRSLPEVHRYLNSLWLLAEDHVGKFDFSCSYGADGSLTDLGRQRVASAAVTSSKSACVDDAQIAREIETQKKIRRWRLCGWPRYKTAATSGSGSWETLAVDTLSLEKLKKSLDTHLGNGTHLRINGKGQGAMAKAEVENEEGMGNENGDGCESINEVSSQESCGTTGNSKVVETGNGKDEQAKKDEALKDVSQLVGKVLADVTAEAQRRHKAEQLRLLAEAEAARKRERLRRQLGESAVSSSNIISGGDRPERRARKVVNYAEADKEVDRQIRRHVNYVEFGKGKGNVSDSDDDQPRRKRVTRGPAADVESRETRTDRMRKRGGISFDDPAASGTGRPRRAAALVSGYGERRVSSSESNSDQWVSGASDEEREAESGRKRRKNIISEDEEDVSEEDSTGANKEREDAKRGSAFGRKGGRLKQIHTEAGGTMEAEEAENFGVADCDYGEEEATSAQAPKRRRILDEDYENAEQDAVGDCLEGNGSGEEGKRIIACEDEETEAGEVLQSSDKSTIATLIKTRERESWKGRQVKKYFPRHGTFHGTVNHWFCDSDTFEVIYSDGDKEVLSYATMKSIVVESDHEGSGEEHAGLEVQEEPANAAVLPNEASGGERDDVEVQEELSNAAVLPNQSAQGSVVHHEGGC